MATPSAPLPTVNAHDPDAQPADERWQFWIDRGGTFTDVVARRPDGTLATTKLLSENPAHYADAAVEGVRRLLGLAPGEAITPARVASVKMGTTVATNALLERRGDRTLLVITRGFGDALRIAWQNRPRLFERHIRLPERLDERVIEADERLGADGSVITPLDEAALQRDLAAAHASGLRACAIVFLHGWQHPAHEARAAELARAAGFTQVSVSHVVSPLMRLVARGDTTVVDAYLSPLLRRYVEQVAAQMPGVPLLFMRSSGALTEARHFAGKDAILSGPAGGIVGMARSALAAGHRRVIGFDMGGTSTDVSHFSAEATEAAVTAAGEGAHDGAEAGFERVFDTQVAGVRVRAPMLNIHTVAAGGGSILRFDGARLRVGPESAGAQPGPACYRHGGPLTVTDANVLLGRLQPAHFPAVFGPQADQPLDHAVVAQRFAALAEDMARATGRPTSAEAVAAGALQVAVAAMAHAIQRISVARGHDVTAYTLQCFGGAGGQHACAVADALGMTRVLIHPLAGVLSAYGMGLADRSALREATLELPLDAAGLALAQRRATELARAAAAELAQQGIDSARLRERRQLHLRYQGTDSALALPWPGSDAETGTADAAALAALQAHFEAAFEAAHQQRFAFRLPGRPLVIDLVTVEAVAPGEALATTAASSAETTTEHHPEPIERVPLYLAGDGGDCGATASEPAGWCEAGLWQREALRPGALIDGPAIVCERNATTLVEPGWRATVTARGDLELQRQRARRPRIDGRSSAAQDPAEPAPPPVDPVQLEVFNHRFMAIAEQMGQRLQNTAHSVNIKERLDFSCALFDAEGQLVANAPHMPVHLGSMSESIRSVIERHPRLRPGEVYALNDPYHGGTHLPDVTVVTPVFLSDAPADTPTDADLRPAFFVASRGHHADIGGITPGSMPPFSRRIDEEGVLIDRLRIVTPTAEGAQLDEATLLALLSSGPHPARNPAQNLADLRAQIAANALGVQALRALVAEQGHATVAAYMRHVQDNAEASVRRAVSALRPGRFTLPLDNGAQIQVAVDVDAARGQATIDFTGTSAQQPHNFNAPKAVTMAAVLYVFRTLVDDDIPLNAGCLRPLRVIVPEGSLLNPHAPAAVVAGNVETSQCVTNALYGALGVMAASPCTMNNFTFGDGRLQYYETLAGGSGAGPGFDGTAVVQTHMTNSRLTDPEVLEWRFPVRLEGYAIRPGSGGAGRWRGGDGGTRRIRFLAPMTASILSNGRVHGAFGAAGGAPGAVGRNRVLRADGRIEELGPLAAVAMQPGDVFEIETPGGGGWGRPAPPDNLEDREDRCDPDNGAHAPATAVRPAPGE